MEHPDGIRRLNQNTLLLAGTGRFTPYQGRPMRRLGPYRNGCQELQEHQTPTTLRWGTGREAWNAVCGPPEAMLAVPLAVSAHRTMLRYYSLQSEQMQARFSVTRAGKTRTSQISTGVGLPYGTPNSSSGVVPVSSGDTHLISSLWASEFR